MMHDLSTQKGRNAYAEGMADKTRKYDRHSIEVHRREHLESLVGRRFKSLTLLQEALIEEVEIIKSQELDGLDLVLDGEYADGSPFTILYLLDMTEQFYVTEVSF